LHQPTNIIENVSPQQAILKVSTRHPSRVGRERERQKRLIKERRSSLQKLSNQINELRGALK